VYEDYAPCYHEEHNCNRLNSDYKNYAIPTDIIEKGASEVKKFRIWFKTVEHYLESDVDIFQMRLKSRWDILTNVKAITADNSGNIKTDNRYIQNIENRIDRLIKSAGRFYYSSPKNTEILKAFSRLTFLAYKEQRIYNNKTGYSDTEVKSFLKYYDEKYKKPLKEELITYYRLKLNPEIKLEGRILDQLGFVACQNCV